MTRRYTAQGTAYVTRSDPGRTRHTGARFERPEDEPPLWLGTFIVAAVIGLIAAVVLFASVFIESPGTSSVNAPTENAKRASATEVGTRKDLGR